MTSTEDPALDPTTPHAARMWNYWMGGKDNYQADRDAGDAVAAVYPDIVTMAVQSRRFLIRVVRYLAEEAGIRQFLDIGTGLPTMENTHEVAQGVSADCKVVYVDNDPMVLAHADALLRAVTPEGVTAYVHADYHDPQFILAEAAKTLDLSRPVAVMFMGVLGYEQDHAVLRSIVSTVMAAVPAGSHLVLWDGTDTGDAVVEGGEQLVESGGVPYILRSPAQLAEGFEGLELVDPGMVPITRWRPATGELGAKHIDAYGAVGRKV
ncbi:SAM-dependent methyltransferase [Streptomyces sp. NPDC051940]|uniref:SAM-dependent methyltransferase n=1 Tax=Streptomyces sp. NPDC051940 TaxID=3155675 RepID=UPI003442A2EA